MKRWIAAGLLMMTSMTNMANHRPEPQIGWHCQGDINKTNQRGIYVKWYEQDGKIVPGTLCYDVGLSNNSCRECAIKQSKAWCKSSGDKESQWCKVYEFLKDDI